MILSWLLGPRRKSKGTRHKPSSPPRARLRVEALEDRTVPASFLVTRGTGVATDQGSLPWAVAQLNATGGDSNEITFQQGVTNIDLTRTLAPIAKNVSINGPNPTTKTVVQRDPGPGVPNFGIFDINLGKTVSISDLIILGGSAGVVNGGGVYNEGTLTLSNVDCVYNSTSGLGGGICNIGTLTMYGGILDGNQAESGGGLYNTGTAILYSNGGTSQNVRIRGNTATAFGGGIGNLGTMEIWEDAEIYSNMAQNGGGIRNLGSLYMSGGSIYDNTASQNGGGIFNGADGTATFSGVTLSGNHANKGGGVYVDAGTVTLDACTITTNTATLGSGGAWKRVNGVNQGTLNLINNCTIGPGQTFVPDGA
jgi:hypothetical protein